MHDRFDAHIDLYLSQVNQTYPWTDEIATLDCLTRFKNVVIKHHPRPWPANGDVYDNFGLDLDEAESRWGNLYKDLKGKLGDGKKVWVNVGHDVVEQAILYMLDVGPTTRQTPQTTSVTNESKMLIRSPQCFQQKKSN